MRSTASVTDLNHVKSLSKVRSEEHTSELQSRPHLVCRLLLEKKNSVCAFFLLHRLTHFAVLAFQKGGHVGVSCQFPLLVAMFNHIQVSVSADGDSVQGAAERP